MMGWKDGEGCSKDPSRKVRHFFFFSLLLGKVFNQAVGRTLLSGERCCQIHDTAMISTVNVLRLVPVIQPGTSDA